MSDSAAEMLTKMKAETAAPSAPPVVGDSSQFYVALRVIKLRRQQLIFGMIASFITFSILLARDYRKDRPWWLTGLPIAAVGLMIALIPPSEEWEYKPWQARARQYERNQIIR